MDSRFYKTVLMPIEVTAGPYCWGKEGVLWRCCPHFDNEGGCSVCTLGLGDLNYDKAGQVLKPSKCLNLQDIRNVH